MQAGIILLCLGFAIFGISETPEDAALFNTGAPFGGGDGAKPSNSTIIPTDYKPPASQTEVDPELGEMVNNDSTLPTTTTEVPPKVEEPAEISAVDLLDEAPSNAQADNDMHDLD